MRVFCWPCNANHEYTPEQLEKIVYAMSALIADLSVDERGTPGGDAQLFLPCYQEMLDMSVDADDYLEHVQQGIACRESVEQGVEI